MRLFEYIFTIKFHACNRGDFNITGCCLLKYKDLRKQSLPCVGSGAVAMT